MSYRAPKCSTVPLLVMPLKKKKLSRGLSLHDTAFIISWATTPPTMAQTGLSSAKTCLKISFGKYDRKVDSLKGWTSQWNAAHTQRRSHRVYYIVWPNYRARGSEVSVRLRSRLRIANTLDSWHMFLGIP